VFAHDEKCFGYVVQVALDGPSMKSGNENHNGCWKKGVGSPRYRQVDR
jgi:hypothetical protein